MSLLTPWFLLGALAIAGPLVFHLVRRTTRERTAFPSLLLLRPSPPRLTRRSRLEDLLLLVLRCLVLALLALGFARPFLRRPEPPAPDAAAGTRTVVLLDTSASMRRAGLWQAARAKAADVLASAGPADQVALFTFDRETTPRLTFSQWTAAPVDQRAALARAALDTASPGWASTRLGPALVRAADEFAESEHPEAGGRRRVVVIGDLQEGSRLDPLQSYEWPTGVEVVPEPVRAAVAGNAGLQVVPEAPDADRTDEPVVRARVFNSADSKREQFRVGWARAAAPTALVAPVDAYVPPGQTRVVSLAVPTNTAGLDQLVLVGDDEPFDNTVFVRPPPPTTLEVLYVGRDAPSDARQPLFFLRRALPETRRQKVHLVHVTPDAPLPAGMLAAAHLVVATAALPDATAAALRSRVESGLTVLFAPATAADGAMLGRLLGAASPAMAEARPSGYAMLGDLDFRHPLLAPFADPRFSDFTRVRYWRYRKLTGELPAGARVVARFDSGEPAWVDFPAGRGRVVLCASGWSGEDSQFALSSKFVPWLYALLDLAGAGTAPRPSPTVGDPLELPTGRTAALAVRRPDGTVTNLSPAVVRFEGTQEPGVYSLGTGTGAVEVAVNLDPAESRTAPMTAEDLERLGVRVGRPAPATGPAPVPRAVAQAAEAEGRQKLWRWLLVAALGILFAETILAGRAAARAGIPREAAP